ncbi:MerR family transcriptional regulator [Halodesulfovibrio spirochaetisodalis]|uniref:MerR family transcriptional regulator n=1 Tax=Halodesulfovibrio spirochaetisodalis TaxID=1560234 RepID=A0A1B7XDM8_9BACT|nr:MerR family transcriptional regulator [Halodesulfovibrio spirochaetisodalis]OBQ52162.1 MerR family transcriptional regulator [Halodesulfovibrio spirochaetisodalis]
MNMKEFSLTTGLTSHTVRYYEKIGLLKNIERTKSGHRIFSHADVIWVEFITRLKDTGMPLKQIQQYAELREQGDHTATDRMLLLEDHAATLEARLALETQHLKKLHDKIAYYKTLISS